jgi:phage shock protein PspC (stress-responsive transcriptional regulator)
MKERGLKRKNGIIAGVCGGLAAFYGISVFWFRLLFIILMIPGGVPGLVPYLLLWLVVPKQRR